jgi:hypothetical protein
LRPTEALFPLVPPIVADAAGAKAARGSARAQHSPHTDARPAGDLPAGDADAARAADRLPPRRAAAALAGGHESIRRLGKFQMYATLLVFALVALPLLVWIYGKFIVGALGWLDLLLYVILPFVALLILTGVFGAPADEVRATPADTPELEKERDHVADVWVSKNFPDW